MKTLNNYYNRCIDAFFEWLCQGLLPTNREDEELPNWESTMMGIFLTIWNVGFLLMPNIWFNIAGVLWLTTGTAWLVYRIRHGMRVNKHDFIAEFTLLRAMGDIPFRFYFWPVDAILYLNVGRTLKRELWAKSHSRMIKRYGYCRSAHDGLIRAADAISQKEFKEALERAEHIRELPGQIRNETRTACACGATVMTIASAAAAPAPTTSTNRLETRTDGWVSVVGTTDLPLETRTMSVSSAHVRVTVTDKKTGLLTFAELELTTVGRTGANWLQMAYIGYKPNSTDEIRLGHIALAPPWMEPPPFLEEPVSFPRFPYNFYGWGLQYDFVRGPWHSLMEATTDSAKNFDDPRQLESANASFRITRQMSPTLTLGIGGELGERAQTFSLDVSAQPHPQVHTRGTVYTGTREGRELVGAYVTTVLCPSKRFGKRFDLHSLADVQSPFRKDHDPLRLTVGTRVQTANEKWSATLDWTQTSFKANGGRIEMRLQHRF